MHFVVPVLEFDIDGSETTRFMTAVILLIYLSI